MATVALWHLGLTAALAALLVAVIVLRSLSDLVHRRRRGAHRAVAVPAQRTVSVEPRRVFTDDPVPEPASVLGSAAPAH